MKISFKFQDLKLKIEVFKQIDECINNDRTSIGKSQFL